MHAGTRGVKAYDAAAGGWGALAGVARAIREQMDAPSAAQALLRNNQPDGFDCPGCAWPDPKHTSTFEFCENGAKAVTWEATHRRASPEVFAAHTVTELLSWDDHAIEDLGRLTHPMAYDAASDTFRPITWEAAFAHIGAALNALPDPNMVEFYASGRASNEAAFLWQLFARAYGTNNFPDCSNMCHEASSVGLRAAIGVGKGTVTLEDFDKTDAIFSFGHNPGTNHPRMMTTLRAASKRGATIVAFNPLKERALQRFTAPQNAVEMATQGSTSIATVYHQLRVGGDIATLKGLMKAVLELDAENLIAGGQGYLDRRFIHDHTGGFERLAEDLEALDWERIELLSGLTRAALTATARIYCDAESVILPYGMGLTQHARGTEAVQLAACLLMLRGNIGRPGAGICPVRGHSNVQGDRTVGIDEKAPAPLREGIQRVFGFEPPAAHGHNAVEAIKAIAEGRSKIMIMLGGNLAVAMPGGDETFAAVRKLDLAVHIATKPNRSHLLLAKETLLLPCLGRTDRDEQASGIQSVTVEDSMSMVHASTGRLEPPSEHVRSEPAIVAGMAKATLGSRHGLDWDGWTQNYDRIRDSIEAVLPAFADYNARVRQPGGFRLPVSASERVWATPSGKAEFFFVGGLPPDPNAAGDDVLTLATIRAHDQYNTTIYGFDDRYRGVFGRRDIVFLNAADLEARGLRMGDRIDVVAVPHADDAPGAPRALRGYTAVAHDIPRGSAAAYFPEANVLIPLHRHDPRSGTPAYKSIAIRISASEVQPNAA